MRGGATVSALISSFFVLTTWLAIFMRRDSRLRRLSSENRIPMLSIRAEGLTFSRDGRRRAYEDTAKPCAAANPPIALWLQSTRPVGRVAELKSLDDQGICDSLRFYAEEEPLGPKYPRNPRVFSP